MSTTTPLQGTRQQQPGALVYLAGVATTALVLWLVNLASDAGVNVLGWYVNAIFPVGALLIGIASGSGYAIASYKFNVKLSRPFVIGMLSTGLLDYAAAQYLSYSALLEQHHLSADAFSFLSFMKAQSEGMSMKLSSSGSPIEMGMFGYVWKALEIAGFAGGTMIPSAALFAMPYCKRCRQYLKKHQLGHASSPVPRKQIFDLPRKERKAALEAMTTALGQRARELTDQLAGATAFEASTTVLAGLDRAIDKTAAGWVSVTLKKCPRCEAHHVSIAINFTGLDKKPVAQKLVDLDRTEPLATA